MFLTETLHPTLATCNVCSRTGEKTSVPTSVTDQFPNWKRYVQSFIELNVAWLDWHPPSPAGIHRFTVTETWFWAEDGDEILPSLEKKRVKWMFILKNMGNMAICFMVLTCWFVLRACFTWCYLGVVVSNIFYFHPYLGKIPILTNIFQRGWNHQPVIHGPILPRISTNVLLRCYKQPVNFRRLGWVWGD